MRDPKRTHAAARQGARPRHAANLIARSVIVRALRQHHLHHVLRGKPAFIGFVGVPAENLEVFAQEATALLRSVTDIETQYEVILWRKENARKISTGGGSLRSLTNNSVVFAFAQDQEDLPLLFQSVADQIVVLGRTDECVLASAFKAFLRVVPAPQILSAAVNIPIEVLNVYLRKGRTLRQAIIGIERYRSVSGKPASDVTPHPRLEALSGLGEVADWGMSLAKDLQEYRERRITWADVDRGVLVSGPSGTGKTTFARALGNTCGVPVHIHSLARWQAKGHLGDLLKAMRIAFDEAIKSAPSILFIDEVDAIGNRSNFQGDHEQYCREVVDAILECLDGAEGREGVIVVAATNHPDKVDPALQRPGRLDRHLRIPLPDLNARSAILRYHLGTNLAASDLTGVARRLEGATGAMIEQIVRDARRRARRSQRQMMLEDLEHGLPRVRLSESAFRRACVHESGHALVGQLLSVESGNIPTAVQVLRETIASKNDVGQTAFYRVPGFDRSKASCLAEITTLLAGLAAEDVVLGGHAMGSGGGENSDLHLATVLAARFEASFGLGGSLVYLISDNDAEVMAHVRRDTHLRRQIHARLKACAHRARTLVGRNREKLELLADALAQRNDLTSIDISNLVGETNRTNLSSNCDYDEKGRITLRSTE